MTATDNQAEAKVEAARARLELDAQYMADEINAVVVSVSGDGRVRYIGDTVKDLRTLLDDHARIKAELDIRPEADAVEQEATNGSIWSDIADERQATIAAQSLRIASLEAGIKDVRFSVTGAEIALARDGWLDAGIGLIIKAREKIDTLLSPPQPTPGQEGAE